MHFLYMMITQESYLLVQLTKKYNSSKGNAWIHSSSLRTYVTELTFGAFLRSLRSYFVVKSLHFLKESKILKYFSLSLSYTTKPKNHGKDWKMYPWNWGVSIRHSTMEQFTDLSFEYVNSVCKIYILLESKWKHCIVTMAFYLIISSFNRYFWRFWPYLES